MHTLVDDKANLLSKREISTNERASSGGGMIGWDRRHGGIDRPLKPQKFPDVNRHEQRLEHPPRERPAGPRVSPTRTTSPAPGPAFGGTSTESTKRAFSNTDRRPIHRARCAESVARSVCGLVRARTALSRCDRGSDEECAPQSSEYGPANARRPSRESNEMRPLRYSINVTFDGCCHHEAGLPPDEESMRYWTAQMERADALLFGRVTYEMMESAWRQPATGRWSGWMREWEIPFAEIIDRAKKHVVSSALSEVDWNAELVRGDLGQAVQRLKQEPGEGLFVGGVTLPLALADLGLIDEYEFLVQPVAAGHGPTLLAGLRERIQLELVDRHEFRSGAVALRCRPARVAA